MKWWKTRKWLKKGLELMTRRAESAEAELALRRKLMVYVPPMTTDEILRAFVGMSLDTPVIRSVVALLRGLEQAAIEDLCSARTGNEEISRHAMRVATCRDAAESVLRAVRLANMPKAHTSGARKSTGTPK